jgi:hypothetical protein
MKPPLSWHRKVFNDNAPNQCPHVFCGAAYFFITACEKPRLLSRPRCVLVSTCLFLNCVPRPASFDQVA